MPEVEKRYAEVLNIRLLTTDELCEMLRVHRNTLGRWRAAGTGPRSTKIGSRVMWSTQDVAEWLKTQRGEK